MRRMDALLPKEVKTPAPDALGEAILARNAPVANRILTSMGGQPEIHHYQILIHRLKRDAENRALHQIHRQHLEKDCREHGQKIPPDESWQFRTQQQRRAMETILDAFEARVPKECLPPYLLSQLLECLSVSHDHKVQPLHDPYFKMTKILLRHTIIQPEHFEALWKVQDQNLRMRLGWELLGRLPQTSEEQVNGIKNSLRDVLGERFGKKTAFEMMANKGVIDRLIFSQITPPEKLKLIAAVIRRENLQSEQESYEPARHYTGHILQTLLKTEQAAMETDDAQRFFEMRCLRYEIAKMARGNDLHLPKRITVHYLPEIPSSYENERYPALQYGHANRPQWNKTLSL